MAEILLRSKGRIGITVEAEVIRPDIFAGKKKEEIEGLIVWQGAKQFPLAEFFDVDVSRPNPSKEMKPEETSIIIEGDVSRVKRIGQGMKVGRIRIQGSAGMHLGEEMSGGSILVEGDAGSWTGMGMLGGQIHIQGNGADHIGSSYRGSWRGMTGGEILIDGNARSQLGGGMVGGRIIVAGNVENFCGIRQSGGLILVKGSAVRGVGAEMNGGTIAVCGAIKQPSPGFVETGREENAMLGDIRLDGWYARFTGDYALGKNPKGSLYCKEG
jgi:formylmethanofuran dehydrogenase subunit C